MVFYSSLFYLPQFFQVALAYSPTRSGVFLLPVLVSQTVASFCAVSRVLLPVATLPDRAFFRVKSSARLVVTGY